MLLTGLSTASAENLKPFVLASSAAGDQAAITGETKSKLETAGFEVVGEYSPYKGASIIIITNDALKNNAKGTDFGGFGVIQRVAITEINGKVQVTYTNPAYMANVYRMKGQLNDVTKSLASALGKQQTYGSEKGLSASDLQGYHYMFGMPYFDEPDVLVDHKSYDQAVNKVLSGLTAAKHGVSQVYRVDVPGKKQTIIGVAMADGESSDTFIMNEVDFKELRSTAHLPYELLIDKDGKVYALNARFRIAVSFPDLSMSGDNSFMRIMGSPDAIKKSLSLTSGQKPEKKIGGFF
ncbi:MAG: hypothetical protein KZQ83_07460 [gamma proteobacterium symbiont of Taylorina sp.]|nr:hypothetical protein [gamma proteobacterium symbiont of Taylorina sp.]